MTNPTIDTTLLTVAIERAVTNGRPVARIAQIADVRTATVEAVRRGFATRLALDHAMRLCRALGLPLQSVMPTPSTLAQLPATAWCDTCSAAVRPVRRIHCPTCDSPVTIGRRTRTLRRIALPQLVDAYHAYAAGASLDDVARAVYPTTTYSSLSSCRVAIRSAWINRGWPLRPRGYR